MFRMMEGNMKRINLLRGEKDHPGTMTEGQIMGIITILIHVMDLPLAVGILKTILVLHQNKCGQSKCDQSKCVILLLIDSIVP
jgi:hypothetical protein